MIIYPAVGFESETGLGPYGKYEGKFEIEERLEIQTFQEEVNQELKENITDIRLTGKINERRLEHILFSSKNYLVNPLATRMKPWVIQSFVTLDRTRKCDHSLESC